MLSALMLDGFGWFRAGDFRRAWLLFDRVTYGFPGQLRRDVGFPALLHKTGAYDPAQLEMGPDGIVAVEEALDRETRDPKFVQLVTMIPRSDSEYAMQVVGADAELRALLPRDRDPYVAAASILSSKLLWQARHTGNVPIVGRAYAWSILAHKLASNRNGDLSSTTAVNCAALGAGLSLRFLSEDALTSCDFAQLEAFKEKHGHLLRKHQLQLLQAAQDFTGLPHGREFASRLEALHIDAMQQRLELDELLQDAWFSVGLAIAKKAVIAGAAGAIPAIALASTSTWPGLLTAAVGPIVSGAAVVASELMDVANHLRGKRNFAAAYLFDAERFLAQNQLKNEQ